MKNSRIESVSDAVMNEGRGLCRVLILGFMALSCVVGTIVVSSLLSGCSTVQRVVNDDATQLLFNRALDRLQARLEEKAIAATNNPAEPGTSPIVAPSTKDDAVDYALLRWEFGGFNGRGALLDADTRISNLAISGNNMSFQFASGSCVTLGAKSASDTGTIIVCLFAKDASGTWRGGKFDWIADNRGARRELHHITGSKPYNNWSAAWIPNPAETAFVLVSMSGRRSNVIKGSWQR